MKIKEFFDNLKSMDKHKRVSLVLMIISSVLLICVTITNIIHIRSYESNRRAGNEKWLMVKEYVQEMDDKVKELEEEINDLESGK